VAGLLLVGNGTPPICAGGVVAVGRVVVGVVAVGRIVGEVPAAVPAAPALGAEARAPAADGCAAPGSSPVMGVLAAPAAPPDGRTTVESGLHAAAIRIAPTINTVDCIFVPNMVIRNPVLALA
jgi:hypothetical protein